VLRLDMLIRECNSLKDKRGCVRQISSRIKGRFEVSVAEVGNRDLWQRAEFGIVSVGADKSAVNKRLDHVLNFVDRMGTAEIIDHSIELINV